MVDRELIQVIGRPPFHDTQLTCSGQLSYLGTSWRKDVAFAGYGVPHQGDISAGKMIFGVEGVDPARRTRLIQMLDIDVYQRLNTMSDGQRRRVQICMGLLKPYEVRCYEHCPLPVGGETEQAIDSATQQFSLIVARYC